jgi:hypothetical protein
MSVGESGVSSTFAVVLSTTVLARNKPTHQEELQKKSIFRTQSAKDDCKTSFISSV